MYSTENQNTELFKDFESLEEAMLNNRIPLDLYINEYNRLISEEARRANEATPWERAT